MFCKTHDNQSCNRQFFIQSWKFVNLDFVKKPRKNYSKNYIAARVRKLNIHPKCIFFFLLTSASWYYNFCYKVFKYLVGYKDDIFQVISKVQIQRSKFGGKLDKFGVSEGHFFQLWWK